LYRTRKSEKDLVENKLILIIKKKNISFVLYKGIVEKWQIQMKYRMKQHQHVLQDRLLFMHGLWMLTKQNYQKVTHFHKRKQKVNKILIFIDVAFKVGGLTSIKYLVLQVHYANIDKFKGNFFDNNFVFNKICFF
jgi:hypothetical protein